MGRFLSKNFVNYFERERRKNNKRQEREQVEKRTDDAFLLRDKEIKLAFTLHERWDWHQAAATEQSKRDRSSNESDQKLFLEESEADGSKLGAREIYLAAPDEDEHNIEYKNENFDFEQRRSTDST